MRAIVKAFEWDTSNVGNAADEPVQLVLHVGPVDGPGDEMFALQICTPAALSRLLERDGLLIGQHFLFVERINTRRVEAFINDRLRRIDGVDWPELAGKIARIGYWEFEVYRDR